VSGGSDVWVNGWLDVITDRLETPGLLLIDNGMPLSVNPARPEQLKMLYFYGDRTPDMRDETLERARRIHVLHGHYTKREAIIRYISKVQSICVHVLVPDAIRAHKFYGFQGDPDPFYYDLDWYNYLNSRIPTKIWIGTDPVEGMLHIPNYYKFTHNSGLVRSDKLGFAARTETRKAVHFLGSHDAAAFTHPEGIRRWERYLHRRFDGTRVIRFDYAYIDRFFSSPEWGVFHGAYYREPFGYSIFQAVDHGKLPIVANDWCPDLEYRYRASTQEEFDEAMDTVRSDAWSVRESEFERIRTYMIDRFGDVDRWASQILEVYNG